MLTSVRALAERSLSRGFPIPNARNLNHSYISPMNTRLYVRPFSYRTETVYQDPDQTKLICRL
jgi:hypothetical protein